MRLDGRVALVTGGASGIGAGIAERFLEAGASVAIFDINEEAAQRTAASLNPKGRALAIHGDAACEDHVRLAVDNTAGQFGSIDVLVNNAGIEVLGAVVDLAAEQWDRQLAVNLRGAFLFSKYAIPRMTGRGGAIVNISSVHAFASYPGCAAYDASKAGLIGLTRAMALDHGPDGIRVNAICPGYIDTPMLEAWLRTQPDREQTMREILSHHPLGRIGTARDIAEAALFLASDAAAFVSGAVLVVDGGMTVAGH